MGETTLNVGPEASSSVKGSSRVKPAPKRGGIPVEFSYSPSGDGIDENLLILLHGLGDTEIPFAKLGRQLRLPQTATLSLRAPGRIPYLYEDAFQWYESFDQLGELLAHPNPTPALEILDRIIHYLIELETDNGCGWPLDRIHFFGFGQGGTVVAECALRLWKCQLGDAAHRDNLARGQIASIVSVEGPLLEFPRSSLRVLAHHSISTAQSVLQTLRRFGWGAAEGMPRSKDEWAGIVEFWGRVLGSRMPEMEGLHPVISGGPTLPPQL
ncbi:hypothetical protein BS47DRAFT_1374025 [Hydnum rufescens UP504]|uniref:Phospholipase/carboxylesterase/thioesterase domain-containing protein n=1 Tax=Hydnum rufescens UP504 TaxID=1448309 RepID=A0A9P6AJB1_9AGAM|nr:hypothetical protein BS47DRAFT_1374025 [Hydnum rufescens UP504]